QPARFQRLALLDMGFEVADMPPAFGARARPAGKTCVLQYLSHAAVAVAIPRGVDLGFRYTADIRSRAQEMAEMAFLVAPGRDLDGAGNGGIAIQHAGRFERIDNAQGAVEPARIVLALKVRSREQLRPRF